MTTHPVPAALFAVLLAGFASGAASAAGPLPDRYDMPNGNTGSYAYWDESYSGGGCVTCDGAALSGGRGDLTDGVVAAGNWFDVEAPAGNGPYVGWTIDPIISFHWNAPVGIQSVTLYLDDSDGAGEVSAPASVVIGGSSFAIAEPAGSAPFAFTASGLSFNGTDLSITLNRKNTWVFLSEVAFNATPVPEAQTWAMLAAGLGLLAAVKRRR